MIHPSYALAQSKLKDIGRKKFFFNFSIYILNQQIDSKTRLTSALKGIEVDVSQNQLKLAQEGEQTCEFYLRAVLAFRYPKLPEQGIRWEIYSKTNYFFSLYGMFPFFCLFDRSIVDYLMNTDTLSFVAKNLGITDLIKTEVLIRFFPYFLFLNLKIYNRIFKEFPICDETLRSTLMAVIGALKESSVIFFF